MTQPAGASLSATFCAAETRTKHYWENKNIRRTERAAIDSDAGAMGPEPLSSFDVKEGEKYRVAAQRLREQADLQLDHAISDQFRKIADRYDELAQQVEAAARRAD